MAAQRPFSLRAFAVRQLSRMLGVSTRGHDAAGWKRFPREARMGRAVTEALTAAPAVRSKARYFVANDGNAAAAVAALCAYLVGAGPMPAHADAEAVTAFTEEFWNSCDADGRTDFGGLVALAVRAMIVDGECFLIFLQTADGLKLRLIPAEQVDESLSRDLGGGAFIAAGIEFDAQGNRRAYWIRPFLPTQQFETWAPPQRIDAADVLHLGRVNAIGEIRHVSWFAPILLKLADLGLLNDALLKGFQISALNSIYLIDRDSTSGLAFQGDKEGDTLEVSAEPGGVRILRGNWDFEANTPQQAQQSIEYLNATIETIAAGLGVPAFMVSANVSRANYSSLRAALITFKAHLEALQNNVVLPQLLAPIWNRWALTRTLQSNGDVSGAAEWRFPAAPEADSVKAAQASKIMLDAKLMSRREAIAQRGESIERVDSDIAADPFAQSAEQETEDSNA